MDDELRGTGRTTRMLGRVLKEALSGRSTLLVISTHQMEARRQSRCFSDMAHEFLANRNLDGCMDSLRIKPGQDIVLFMASTVMFRNYGWASQPCNQRGYDEDSFFFDHSCYDSLPLPDLRIKPLEL